MKQALYRWFDADGVLLYVGISSTLPSRVKQHSKSAAWFDEASFMTIEWHEGRSAVERAERRAIAIEAPLYNLSHKLANEQKPSQVIPPNKSADKLLSEIEYLKRLKLATEQQMERQHFLNLSWQKRAEDWKAAANYWERRLLFQMPANGWK